MAELVALIRSAFVRHFPSRLLDRERPVAASQENTKETSDSETKRASTPHPLQLLAAVATIATFLIFVVSGGYSLLFRSGSDVVLAAKVDWIDLPSRFAVDDPRRFSELTDELGRVLKFEELTRVIPDFQYGSRASLVKLTIENRGAATSKTVRVYFDDFMVGVEVFRRGSVETQFIFPKDNFEVGILDPGDAVTLYAVTKTHYYKVPPTRVLQAEKIVSVVSEKYVDTGVPLDIVPWEINHPTLTGFVVLYLAALVGLFFVVAIPIAVRYLWRAIKNR